jgi:hypothetical protein
MQRMVMLLSSAWAHLMNSQRCTAPAVTTGARSMVKEPL